MFYFDPDNPNKYRGLKKLLVPYTLDGLEFDRFGQGDGSYVVPSLLRGREVAVLSYGVGDDPEGVSFEEEFDQMGCYVQMFDGSIDEPPVDLEYGVFFKQNLTEENFQEHLKFFNSPLITREFSILKMDIEGCEYDWLSDRNFKLLGDFDIFCVEVHSLIEECPENWVFPEAMLDAKKNRNKVFSFFEKLNNKFILWHMHGNNHAPKYVDFPDSLELTYINKESFKAFISEKYVRPDKFPVDFLDKRNYDGREDYVLDWWL